MTHDPQADDDAPEWERESPYRHLPPRVLPEDLTEAEPTEFARDPDGGRNPQNDWLIRHA